MIPARNKCYDISISNFLNCDCIKKPISYTKYHELIFADALTVAISFSILDDSINDINK